MGYLYYSTENEDLFYCHTVGWDNPDFDYFVAGCCITAVGCYLDWYSAL